MNVNILSKYIVIELKHTQLFPVLLCLGLFRHVFFSFQNTYNFKIKHIMQRLSPKSEFK